MRFLRAAICCGLVLGAGGCTFNVEQDSRTLAWAADLGGAGTLRLDDAVFEGIDIDVSGIVADSLLFACTVQRLAVSGEPLPDDITPASRTLNGIATLSISASGEDWVGCQLSDVDLQVGRENGLDITTTGGSLDVVGMRGNLTLQTTGGGVTVVLDADSTGLPADTVLRSVDIQTTSGDVLVRVPAGFSAELDLQTSSGAITVQGVERSVTTWTRPLSGGNAARLIRCITTSGDITIEEAAAP